ncbi:hypothetical protein [uncultured Dysgonomonas sp.]|uniref:Uncharacterized protein n=1 Tax=uncultured Dysgonomonas sp. TaxID=206096 RepID=A0A212IXA9_9BACT|nr:hypothetical protein [uncultured Dysgonomonas sp.]SBV91848.1 conserved hypothetical protein [uncultured Dysgonomonas sp.]
MEEIKAGDIMLNNWVLHNGELRQISGWHGEFVSLFCKGCDKAQFETLTKNIKPIPLTEDILLKAGGYKLPHMTVTDSVLFDIGRDRILSIGCIEDCNQMAWLQHIEGKKVTDLVCIHNYDYDGWLYLHTLQNLFKSLTGNDLKIEV